MFLVEELETITTADIEVESINDVGFGVIKGQVETAESGTSITLEPRRVSEFLLGTLVMSCWLRHGGRGFKWRTRIWLAVSGGSLSNELIEVLFFGDDGVLRCNVEVDVTGGGLQNDHISVTDFLTFRADFVTRQDSPTRIEGFRRRELFESNFVVSLFVGGTSMTVNAQERVATNVEETNGLTKSDFFAETTRSQIGRNITITTENLEDCVLELMFTLAVDGGRETQRVQ